MKKNYHIGLVDFKAHYKHIEEEIDNAIKRVLKSGRYVLGKEVASFEDKLASFIGSKYAVGVASGTDALTLSLKALGLKKGDGVLMPANVYPTAFGVSLAGIEVQLSDVNRKTFNIDIKNIKKACKKNTKALVLVHLYGNPVDIDPIKRFTKEKGIVLIEDCAQAIGATYNGRKVGTFGDVSCFSFYPTKNLGAFGDGGAVVTNNRKIYEKVRLLRMYGEKERYNSLLVGHNSRLDEIQAAILTVKLRYLKRWNDRRRKIADTYLKALKNTPLFFPETKVNNSVYHLFVGQTGQRTSLSLFLKEKGVDTAVHYPVPVHLSKSFAHLGYKKGDFPISEELSNTLLSFPIYPEMDMSNVNHVIKNIREFFDIK